MRDDEFEVEYIETPWIADALAVRAEHMTDEELEASKRTARFMYYLLFYGVP